MNLLHYTSRECPPDKWRFKDPHTGVFIEEFDKATWLAKIRKFYEDNNLPLEPGWEAVAEDRLCRTLEPGFCEYEGGYKPENYINVRSTLETILAATRVFLAFVQSGGKLVAPEVAEERAKTCAACFAAVPMQGCGGCVGLAALVTSVVGAGKTSADHALANKQCAVCGCAALPNTWIPVEVSEVSVTPEMMSNFPEWCWKAKEIRELRASA